MKRAHFFSSKSSRWLILFTFVAIVAGWNSGIITAQTAEFTQNSGGATAVTVQVPLGNYPGRGISLPVTLNYSSRGLWRIGFLNDVPYFGTRRAAAEAIYAEYSTAGWTTSLNAPVIEWPKANDCYTHDGKPYARGCTSTLAYRVARVFVHMPDGSTHEVRKTDAVYQSATIDMIGTFYAVDGSRMRYDSSGQAAGTLYLADGTRYIFDGNAVQYIDRNGNTLNYNLANRQWTDTLGRTFNMPWPASPAAGDYSYSLPGLNNGSITYTLKFRALSNVFLPDATNQTLKPLSDYYLSNPSAPPSSSNFPQGQLSSSLFFSDYSDGNDESSYTYVVGRGQSGAANFDPVVLAEIDLPNGTNYQFFYNAYGELDKVIYPTGGYERYKSEEIPSLGSIDVPYDQGSRGLTSRWISPSGNNSDEAQWQYSFNSNGGYCVSVTAPDATRSDRCLLDGTVWNNFGYKDARDGLPVEERAYRADGVMLRRSLTDYAQSSQTYSKPSGGYGTYTAYRNARPIRTVSLILDTGGDALAAASTFGYDPTYEFTVGLDQTSSNQYQFAAINQTTAQSASIASIPNGSLARTTLTSYLTSDANYLSRNILGLASSTTIQNSSGQTVAQSMMSYDEPSYPLLTYGSVTGWNDPQTTYRGNLTTTSRWLDLPTPTWISSHAQYDQTGNVRYAWDPRGSLSSVSYSASYAYAFPTQTSTAVPDPNGTFGSNTPLTASTTFDFNTGLVTSSTDANSQTTTYEYVDPLNRLTRVNLPDGGRTTHTYVDAHTCGAYVETRTLIDSTGRETDAWQFSDGLGRPYLAESLDNQDPSNPYLRVDTQYDSMGRVSRVSNPYRTPGCTSAINPSGNWTTNSYAALSRVVAVTTPDGAQVTTAYSAVTAGNYLGPSVTVTDQAGKARESISDAEGRVVQVIEDPNGLAYQTNYTYDALNNLRKVEQGAQLRYYGYDSFSRVIRIRTLEQTVNGALNWTDPATGNSQWTMALGYDENGNVTARVDARNITTTLAYDALNRNYSLSYSDGTPAVYRIYDFAPNGRGRLYYAHTVGVSVNVFDAYDPMGRPTQYRQHFWVNNSWTAPFSVQRTYDKAGDLTAETYPSGHTVNYTFDVATRTSSFSGNLGDGASRTYSTGTSYSPYGGMTQEQFGTTTPIFNKRHYNVRGQLYDVRASSFSLTQNEFDWNRGCLAFYYGGAAWGQSSTTNNGDVTLQQHWVPTDDSYSNYSYTQDHYAYDSLNRLYWTGEVHGGPWGQSGWDYAAQYNYDRYGNRTVDQATWNVPHPNYSVDANTNRLVAPAGYTYGFDAAGNQTYDNYTGEGARSFNAENRMTQAWSNNQWQTYVYDGDGRRIKRIVNGVETWQVYGISGELLAEYAAGAPTFIPTKEYGYRGGELLVTASSGDDQRMQRFIQALYFGVLARVPTSAEMQQQTTALAQAGAQGQSQLLTTAQSIALSLFQSTEYASRNRTDREYVSDLYNTYLQRGPDQGGWDYWTSVVPINGRSNVLTAFAVCSEFATVVSTLYGSSASDNARTEHFVWTAYIGSLARVPSDTEMQQQRDALNNAAASGQAQVQAQAETMARGLFNSQEYINRNRSDRDYVSDLYETFLQRAPDQGGWDYWTSVVPTNGRAGVLNAFAICGPFRELAGTIYREVNWLVSDQLGTPRMIVDRTGSLAGVKRHDYLPFGEELYAGPGARTTAWGYTGDNSRQHFTGYEMDSETGLNFAQARYQSSMQGRFTSVDPLGKSANVLNPQSFNRYSYVLNNPVNSTDPSGMMSMVSASASWGDVAGNFWGEDFGFGGPHPMNGNAIVGNGMNMFPDRYEDDADSDDTTKDTSDAGTGGKAGAGSDEGKDGEEATPETPQDRAPASDSDVTVDGAFINVGRIEVAGRVNRITNEVSFVVPDEYRDAVLGADLFTVTLNLRLPSGTRGLQPTEVDQGFVDTRKDSKGQSHIETAEFIGGSRVTRAHPAENNFFIGTGAVKIESLNLTERTASVSFAAHYKGGGTSNRLDVLIMGTRRSGGIKTVIPVTFR